MEFQLRLLILVIGLAVIALLYYFGTRRGRPGRPKKPAPAPTDEPQLSAEADDEPPPVSLPPRPRATGEPVLTDLPLADEPPGEPAGDRLSESVPEPPARPAAKSLPTGQTELDVVMTVRAPAGQPFTGLKLLSTLQAEDYSPNQRNTWDYCPYDLELPLFSVAHLKEPGTFDIATMGELETPGLLLFTKLPRGDGTTISSARAIERMLEAAQHLAELLGGELCNHSGNPLDLEQQYRLRSAAAEIDQHGGAGRG